MTAESGPPSFPGRSPSGRQVRDIDDPRLVKALAHPLRVQVLEILERREASTKEIAFELGVPVENLSYHVRMLRDLGFIELERTRPVRGSIERYYRAAARPEIAPEAWDRLPLAMRNALESARRGEVADAVARAGEARGLAGPGANVGYRRARLDSAGAEDAARALDTFLARIDEIERQTTERLGERSDTAAEAVIVATMFAAGDPAEKPEARGAVGPS